MSINYVGIQSHSKTDKKVQHCLYSYRSVLASITIIHASTILFFLSQKALARRLKDVEMFSAGIVQQMIRRQEKMQRTQAHLQKGKAILRECIMAAKIN